jgi:putative nucleotidyltransferase with HDIG domain
MSLVTLEQLRAKVTSLPPLPQAVHDLNDALRRADVSSDDVVAIVSRDPALSVTALRLANSPFYGVSGRVATLRDAVQILGLQTLTGAVTTAAVMASFDRDACTGFDFDIAWRHAIATAFCAQLLAELRDIDSLSAYTAGLLHDIGRLALATHFPQELAQAIAWGRRNDVLPHLAEREVLGVDHQQAGAMLAAHWRLPPSIVEMVACHHDAEEKGRGSLFDVVHVADAITHALDLSRDADEMVPPLSPSAWQRLALDEAELQHVFEQVETRSRAFSGVSAGA